MKYDRELGAAVQRFRPNLQDLVEVGMKPFDDLLSAAKRLGSEPLKAEVEKLHQHAQEFFKTANDADEVLGQLEKNQQMMKDALGVD